MRILLTNDDGIHAEGLAALERIARQLSDDVWVVAPEHDQSGFAHSLSLSDPLRLRKVGEKHYAVRGTPTDCIIMGCKNIMPELPAAQRALTAEPMRGTARDQGQLSGRQRAHALALSGARRGPQPQPTIALDHEMKAREVARGHFHDPGRAEIAVAEECALHANIDQQLLA